MPKHHRPGTEQAPGIRRLLLPAFVLAATLSATTSAATMTTIDGLQRGMTSAIQGEVTRILDEDEFRLTDSSGSIRVYTGWQNRVTIPTGERITVHGFLDDDLVSYVRPEFYATRIVREDGAIIPLRHD
jgi:hypothetical protein